MYKPSFFSEERIDKLHGLIRQHSFAAMISISENTPVITHLPFSLDATSGKKEKLISHMAKANYHWKLFEKDPRVTVIFSGPHAYISPAWYPAAPTNVPTWNYMVAHVSGTAKLVDNPERQWQTMLQLIQENEAAYGEGWLADASAKSKLGQIAVFEIEIESIDGKFKLSQQQAEKTRQHVARKLLDSGLESAEGIGKEMLSQPFEEPLGKSIGIRRAFINEAKELSCLAFRSKSFWPYPYDYLLKCVEPLRITESDITDWPVNVALKKEEKVGFMALKMVSGEHRLDHLWIDPRFIGQGIGQVLFECAVKEARTLGWESFRIAADPYALGFYTKMGAKQIGTVQSRIKPDLFLPHLEVEL